MMTGRSCRVLKGTESTEAGRSLTVVETSGTIVKYSPLIFDLVWLSRDCWFILASAHTFVMMGAVAFGARGCTQDTVSSFVLR